MVVLVSGIASMLAKLRKIDRDKWDEKIDTWLMLQYKDYRDSQALAEVMNEELKLWK